MMNNTITDIIDETFTITIAPPPASTTATATAGTNTANTAAAMITIPLCPQGDTISVTEENKYQYIYLIILYYLKYSIKELLESFLLSFTALVPLSILQQTEITSYELQLMLNGKITVNVEELRAYCLYDGDKFTFHENNELILWFWRCVREMREEEKRQLLVFFTGSSRVPLDGYDPPITITEGEDMAIDSFPKAHTCFNQLVLPAYSSYQKLKEKVLFAMNNTEGFGMA